MKQIPSIGLITLVISIVLHACSPPDSYRIKGDLKGFDGEIVMNLLDAYGQVINSCVSTDGKFEMNGSVETPMLAYLNNGFNGTYPLDIPIILENADIKVKGDIPNRKMAVTGTQANEEMMRFKADKSRLSPADKNGYIKLVKDLFDNNTDNFLSALLISNLSGYISDEELLEYCDRVPDSFFKDKSVAAPRDIARARVNTAAGRPYVDIALTDEDGNAVNLSDVAGKESAVILVFWNSWCRNIPEYFTELVSLHRRYSPHGLVLFTVSFDHQPDRWSESVQKYGLPGFNYRLGTDAADSHTAKYGITSLPYALLIDPDGIITARGELSEIADGLRQIYPK